MLVNLCVNSMVHTIHYVYRAKSKKSNLLTFATDSCKQVSSVFVQKTSFVSPSNQVIQKVYHILYYFLYLKNEIHYKIINQTYLESQSAFITNNYNSDRW